jgi:hypothetical protein
LLDEAQFIFRQSIRTEAGNYNKQHSSFELTAGCGMKASMVERRANIFATTSPAFQESAPCNAKVVFIMTWWRNVGQHIFELGRIINSQEKVNDQKLRELKSHIVEYCILCKKIVTWKNPVFWKMHQLMCSYIDFVEKTRMSGRVNAQGMENKHYVMGKLKFMMGRVINTLGWVSKLSQRQQIICLLPNICRKRKLVEEKTARTGKRGPYKSRGLVTRKNESSLEATDCK